VEEDDFTVLALNFHTIVTYILQNWYVIYLNKKLQLRKKWCASLSEITNEKWINGCNHVKKTEDEIMEEVTGNTPNIRRDGSDEESQRQYMLSRQ
jgi:hypothetical protein